MVLKYYFDYTNKPELFPNRSVEAKVVGNCFLKCVAQTMQEYGIQVTNAFQCLDPEDVGINRYAGFIFEENFGLVKIYLTNDYKLKVDFGTVHALDYNNKFISNDIIMISIREKAVENKLIEANAEIHAIELHDEPSESAGRSGGCYVATAVYGSYNCPEVWTLRRFRDFSLAESWYGRAFIKLYYAVSPTLVKWFGDTPWFNRLCRAPLDKLVTWLKANGYEDSPYND